MSDDRPRAPTYGPLITIPSAYFLGLVAYNIWVEAHPDEPSAFWADLDEAERELWQRIATKVAERIRHATEHSHALGNYLPPPRCRAKRRDRYSFYIQLLHLLPLGLPPGRNWRRRRRPPLGTGRAMSWLLLCWPRSPQGLHNKQVSAAGALTNRLPAPKGSSAAVVTCEDGERRRSTLLRECPWLSARDRAGLL
jgi:hypothetical protein